MHGGACTRHGRRCRPPPGEPGDAGGVRGSDHRDHAVHAEAGEALVGRRPGCRHEEPVGVAARPRRAPSRAMSSRRGSDGPPGSVDAVADAAGQLGHLRAEPADDHGRRRVGSQEAGRPAGRARPHLRAASRPSPRPRRGGPRRRAPGVRARPARRRTACPTPPPAPTPSSSRPPLTSCSVAAITASVPASRLATLSTSEPIVERGDRGRQRAEHGPALEHVRRRRAPTRRGGRTARARRSRRPRPASAASRRSSQRPPNGSNSRSTCTPATVPERNGSPASTARRRCSTSIAVWRPAGACASTCDSTRRGTCSSCRRPTCSPSTATS